MTPPGGRPTATLAVGLAVLTLGFGCSGEGAERAPVPSESPGGDVTVVRNAEILTLDPGEPRAEALAYGDDGVLVAVGSEADVVAAAGADPTIVDADGAFVLPGFQDPHLHVPEAGLNEELCFFPPEEGLDVYEDIARGCAVEQSGEGWVRGAGASLSALRGATGEPPIDVLDRAVPDRPALVLDDLGHAAWTNTAGLEAAGVAPDAQDPPGGILDRDPQTGRLTGLLLENAQHRVRDAAAVDADTAYGALLATLPRLAREGVTSVSDAGGYWTRGHDAAWRRARDEDRLTVRANNTLHLFPDRPLSEQLAELSSRRDADPSDLLRFDTAKVYVDGILELGSALVEGGYAEPIDPDLPEGFAYFDRAQLERAVAALHDRGFRINFHAVGDAGVRRALDAVEALDAEDVAERRHRTTHNYLVHPEDRPRFAELGMVADLQMAPPALDRSYRDETGRIAGRDADEFLPLAALLDAGAPASLSSDWDADPLSPLGGIERAVTREAQGVDVETAIRLATLGGAHAMAQEDTTGSLVAGKEADLVFLDRNLLDVDPGEISEATVLRTIVGGRTVHP